MLTETPVLRSLSVKRRRWFTFNFLFKI